MSTEAATIFWLDTDMRLPRHSERMSYFDQLRDLGQAVSDAVGSYIERLPFGPRTRRVGRFALAAAVSANMFLTGTAGVTAAAASVYYGPPIVWAPKGVDEFVETFFPSDAVSRQLPGRGPVIVVESPARTGQ